jgi:hypothetical protein
MCVAQRGDMWEEAGLRLQWLDEEEAGLPSTNSCPTQ